MFVVGGVGGRWREGITGLCDWSSQGWLGMYQVAYTFWTAVSILTRRLHSNSYIRKHKFH